jgi:hypothetical protein
MDVKPKPQSFFEFETVRDFIQEKWTNMRCECCGNQNWTVGGLLSQNTFGVLIPKQDLTYMLPVNVANIVYASCSNCGHLRLVGSDAISAWLEKRQSDSGDRAR